MEHSEDTPRALAVARRFAAALDLSDWEAVAACLTANCEYSFRGKSTHGREQIVSSYRTIGDWVDATFESVRYESAVDAFAPGRARISFRDLMDHRGHHLDFRCQQIVTLGTEGAIAHIEHVDLPGEAEKVEKFNAACGVQKP